MTHSGRLVGFLNKRNGCPRKLSNSTVPTDDVVRTQPDKNVRLFDGCVTFLSRHSSLTRIEWRAKESVKPYTKRNIQISFTSRPISSIRQVTTGRSRTICVIFVWLFHSAFDTFSLFKKKRERERQASMRSTYITS